MLLNDALPHNSSFYIPVSTIWGMSFSVFLYGAYSVDA